jgi:hypothetical protein
MRQRPSVSHHGAAFEASRHDATFGPRCCSPDDKGSALPMCFPRLIVDARQVDRLGFFLARSRMWLIGMLFASMQRRA